MPPRAVVDPARPRRLLKAAGADVVPLVREALRRGGAVRLEVTGASMRPFIRSGDVVELAAAAEEALRPGAVVLVDAGSGRLVLHRISRRAGEALYTRGDACLHEEGPFTPASVVALAAGVLRSGRVAPLDRGARRSLARAWHAGGAGPRLLGASDAGRRAAGDLLRRLGLRPPPAACHGHGAPPGPTPESVLEEALRAYVRGAGTEGAPPAGFDDWEGLLELADAEGVEGVLAASSPSWRDAPERWLADLSLRALQRITKNTLAHRQLAAIAAAFDGAGVPVVAVKGAAFLLARDADPGFRDLSDIDLLVRERELPAALRVLASLGYANPAAEGKSLFGEDARLAAHAARHGHAGHVPRLTLPGGLGVELHLNCLHGAGDWAAAEADLWAESRRAPCGRGSLLCPTPAHALVLGCVHYHRHLAWGSAGTRKWLLDIALDLPEPADKAAWSGLLATARRWGVAAEVAAVLPDAIALAGAPAAPLPADAPRAVRPSARYGASLRAVRELPGGWTRCRYLWRLAFPARGYMELGYHVPPGAWLAPHHARRLARLAARLVGPALRAAGGAARRRGGDGGHG